MSDQLTFLPTSPPDVRHESLRLEAIDGFADAAPSAKLRELIRDLGLLQPIIVVPTRSGRFRIVEGRRRCKAIEQLAEAGEWPTPPHVHALVLDGRRTARREVSGGLALALHASRSASPASELAAIESMLQASASDAEAATVKEISAQTGISPQTVRRRLRLRSLTPPLRAALDEASIAASVAETAARLPEEQQTELEHRLEEGKRLTLADVRELTREQTAAATGGLPGALFADQDVAWQTTVRGHLNAALAAVPEEGRPVLQERIAEVLASVDDEGPPG